MTISNLLGSNLFDILILAVDDIAFVRGPLHSAVSPSHSVTAFSAIIMTGIVIVAFLYRPTARLFRIGGWVSPSLLVVYLLNTLALYRYGH